VLANEVAVIMARMAVLLAALAVASAAPPVDDKVVALAKARSELNSLMAAKMRAETELADVKGKEMNQLQATQLARLEVDGLRNEEKFAKSEEAWLSAKVQRRQEQHERGEDTPAEVHVTEVAQKALLRDQGALKAMDKEVQEKKAWLKEQPSSLKRLRSKTKDDEAALKLAKRKFDETAVILRDAKEELEVLRANFTGSESSTEAAQVEWLRLKKAREDRLAQDEQTAKEIAEANDELIRDTEKMKEVENETLKESQEADASLAKEQAILKSEEDEILNKSAAAKELAAAQEDLERQKKANSAVFQKKEAEHKQKMLELEAKLKKNAAASLSALEDQIQDKQDELARERARNKVESEALQEQLDSLKKDLETVDRLRDSADKDAQKKEDNIRESSMAMLDNDKMVLKKLQDKHEELMQTETDLSNLIGTAVQDLSALNQAVDAAKARIAAVKEREHEHYQSKLKEVKEEDSKEYDILEEELKDLQTKYDAIHRNKVNEVTDLNHQLKALKEKSAKLRGNIH